MGFAQQRAIAFADYLSLEQAAQAKHQLIDGELFAMAGATRNHARITGNAGAEIRSRLRGSPCEVFTSDMLVKCGEEDGYYPDVVVGCDPEDGDPLFLERPVLIIEVLSKSTAYLDKGRKQREYCALPTLREYVLIDQYCVDVWAYRRPAVPPAGQWAVEYLGENDILVLETIDLRIPVKDLYDRVVWEE
jgi:Uma2 family endonuclease